MRPDLLSFPGLLGYGCLIFIQSLYLSCLYWQIPPSFLAEDPDESIIDYRATAQSDKLAIWSMSSKPEWTESVPIPEEIAVSPLPGFRLREDGNRKLDQSPITACIFDGEGKQSGRGEPLTLVPANSDLVRPDCEFVVELDAFVCPPDRFLELKLRSPTNPTAFYLTPLADEIDYQLAEAVTDLQIRAREHYRLEYDVEAILPDYLDIGLSAFALSKGEHCYLHIPYALPAAQVVNESGDLLHQLPSESALIVTEESAFFFDQTRSMIVVKIVAPDYGLSWFHLEPGRMVQEGR